MRIWINGQERTDISPAWSRDEILEAVRAEAERRDCAITEIYAGGMEIDPDILMSISDRQDVFFKFRPVSELMDESMDSVSVYVPRLRHGLERLAVMMSIGRGDEVTGTIPNMLEGLEWLLSLYEKCSVLTGAPLIMEEETAVRNELLGALGGMMAGIVCNDADMVSQTLREKVIPFVNMIELRMKDIADSCFRKTPPSPPTILNS